MFKLRVKKGTKVVEWYCAYCTYQHSFRLDDKRDYEDHGKFVSSKKFCDNEIIVTYTEE